MADRPLISRPVVLVALLLGGALAGWLWWRLPRAVDAEPPAAPAATTTSPAAPAPGAPTPGPPLPYKAEDGSIYTDKLFWGLLSLEESPEPVTAEQAGEVLRVLGLLDAKLRKNQYYDDMLVARLTPEQLAYTERRVAGLRAEDMHQGFNPERIHAIVRELERIGATTRPPNEVEVPPEVPTPERPLTISRMTSFMLSFDGMMADPALAIGAEQARALLPFVDSYVRLKSMKQQTKTDILAVLTSGQKAWIDAHPARQEEISDMTRLTEQVRALMKEKVGATAP